MGIYYFAVDEYTKEIINPPGPFSEKLPSIFGCMNPFSNMVIMMNCYGYNFEIKNDMSFEVTDEYKDITDKVYKQLLDVIPGFREHLGEDDS